MSKTVPVFCGIPPPSWVRKISDSVKPQSNFKTPQISLIEATHFCDLKLVCIDHTLLLMIVI